MALTATRSFAASSTRQVLDAVEELRGAVARPGEDPAHAVRRLESAARRSIDGLDDLEARGYDQPVGATGEQQLPPTEDLLAIALSQLNVAAALTAADQAAAGRPGSLDEAVEGLRAATSTLKGPSEAEQQRYEAAGAAPLDLAGSVEACRAQVATTLDLLCEKSAGVTTQSFAAAKKLAPEQIRDALSTLGSKLSLETRGRRLVQLAVRAVDRALAALARLIPAEALERAQQRMHDLWEDLQHEKPMTAVMATLFDTRGARARADEVLGAGGLQPGRVQTATAELARLAARYGEHAALASAVVTGIGAVSVGLGFLHLVIPHLAAVTASAVLLVIATVVLLGMDYADAGGGLDRVKGVRVVLGRVAG